MPIWLEILFAVFSTLGALCAIYTTVCGVLGYFHNKVNEKHLQIEYLAQAPIVKIGHTRPVVDTRIIFHNKTNRNLIISRLELTDGINNFNITDSREPYIFTVLANTKISKSYEFEIKPPKYLLPQECMLKVYVGDKVLTYTVKTNSVTLPY